jgi:hypothetical protein
VPKTKDGKDSTIASYINDSKMRNNVTKYSCGWPIFLSGPDGIEAGQELTYNYGSDKSRMTWPFSLTRIGESLELLILLILLSCGYKI